MSEKRFQKRVENFVCEHCGAENLGDGFTNHCSQCLYSKHVDNAPGDRSSQCGALMEPIRVEWGSKPRLFHRCLGCGLEKPNRISARDSQESIESLAKSISENFSRNLS